MANRILTAALIVLLAALFVRLGGARPTAVPSTGVVAVLALGVLVLKEGLARWRARPADWRERLARHRFLIGLAVLACLAIAIRLPSIGTELGHQPLDIDEHRLGANIKLFFVKGEIGYHTVEHYPGIYFWWLSGTSLLIYLRGLMEGTIHSIRGMPVDSFVLAGRLTSVVVASATVFVTGLIGRQMGGAAAGVLAAGLVAIAPLSVETLTAMRNDPAQVLFVCLAVHAALVSTSSDRRLWLVLAGVFGGTATAIKYTSVFALLPAAMAALLRGSAAERVTRIGLVLLGFALAVAVTNHFVWWDFPNFVRQLSDQVAITGPGHWAAVDNPAAFQAGIIARQGPGWALLVLAAGYGVYGLATGRSHAWVFWMFPLFYSWFTTKVPSQLPRWVFPLVPFVAVAGACALVSLATRLRNLEVWSHKPSARRLAVIGSALAVAAVLAQPVWAGLVTASRRLTVPTQSLVEQWLRQRPAEESVLLEQQWFDVTDCHLTVRRVPDLGKALHASVYALAATDWVIVPEPYFSHPGLKQLTLVKRVSANQRSLGGNLGYDFAIYAPPRVPPSAGHTVIQLDDTAADPFLGQEWAAPVTGQSGRLLPGGGARVYLAPRAEAIVPIVVEVAGDSLAAGASGVAVTDGEGSVQLNDAPGSTATIRTVTGTVRLAPRGRTTELLVTPANPGRPLRVLRIVVG